MVERPRSSPTALTVVVVAGALSATLFKLAIAGSTYGTNDVAYWTMFARGARRAGPVGIYGIDFPVVYNHGPLAGWMLVLLDHLGWLGLDFSTLVRVPASLADLGTAVLVYLLLARHRSPVEAAWVALLVAWSPVLVVISGFHGNTDPVFVMLTLLAVYLLDVRDRPLAGGVAVGLAISVKLVPVVVLPWLLYVAWRRSPRALGRFVGGGALVFAVLWLPVLVREGSGFRDHVLLYRGTGPRQWGLGAVVPVDGPGSLLLLGLAALAPFVLLGRFPVGTRAVAGTGLALTSFLVLTPAFGMQYLSWALAATYLFAPRLGHVYNALASAFVVSVYSHWSGGPPWTWDVASGTPFTVPELFLMLGVWTSLIATIAVSTRGPSTTPERPAPDYEKELAHVQS